MTDDTQGLWDFSNDLSKTGHALTESEVEDHAARARGLYHVTEALSGPEVGTRLPSFLLSNQNNEPVSSESLLEMGPLVIVLYRGAWCPYCSAHLHAFAQQLMDINALGAELVAISPQVPDASLTMAEKLMLTYHVLTDSQGHFAKELGLVFEMPEYFVTALGHLGADFELMYGSKRVSMPVPAEIVVDKDGVIQFSAAHANYTQRTPVSKILEVLEGLTA